MPIRWDAAADARLLVGIVAFTNKIDHQRLAQFMGDGCTPKAIQHRIARLKDRYDETNDTPNGTPTKRKCGPSPGSSKKNKKVRSLENDNESTPDAGVAVLTEKAEPSKAENSHTEHIKLEDYEMESLFSTQLFQSTDDQADPFA